MLLGPAGKNLGYSFSTDGSGFLLALLPPGAFLGLALLIALRNVLHQHNAGVEVAKPEAAAQQPASL